MNICAAKQRLNNFFSEDIDAAINREQTTFDSIAGPAPYRLVLFGAGNFGRRALTGLRKIGIEPLAFADNNPAMWGKEIDGVTIYNPAEAIQRFPESVFVVTIWGAATEPTFLKINRQLSDAEVRKIVHFHILSWKYPDLFLPYYCIDLPHKILENRGRVLTTFDLLSDDRSRQEYTAHIEWRLRMDFNVLPAVQPHQYFPPDLFSLNSEEVFVDCGAYDGDTIHAFLNISPNFAYILAFEADPTNYEKLMDYTNTLPESIRAKIRLLPVAVGSMNGIVSFDGLGDPSSRIGQGSLTVECRKLDDLLEEVHPTFIKMDIEGGEMVPYRELKV